MYTVIHQNHVIFENLKNNLQRLNVKNLCCIIYTEIKAIAYLRNEIVVR